MKRKIVFALKIGLVSLCILTVIEPAVFSEVQVTVKSGTYMKYDIVTEELNWTGWQKFELYEIDGSLIKFNVTIYSDKSGYQIIDGEFNMSEIEAPIAYPNDVIENFIIPANLAVGASFSYNETGPTTIAGETTGVYGGATRTVIYATYTPPAGMQPEASKIDFKWDKETGILFDFNATYPDGKTAMAKITETNAWQPDQTVNPYVWYLLAAVAAGVAVASALFIRRKMRHQKAYQNKQISLRFS
jgi:opacity protein-like surface antigen